MGRGSLIKWKLLITDHHLFKRFEKQSNGSCSIMLGTIFLVLISSNWMSEQRKRKLLIEIVAWKTLCSYLGEKHVVISWNTQLPPKSQIYQGPMNALVYLLLVLTRWHNLSLSLFSFEGRMLLLIDWLAYVTIIWIIFSSMNIAHAKSGSMIPRNSWLIPGLFGIMLCGAWQIFCLGFVAV